MGDLISRQAVLDQIVASVNQFGGRYTAEQLNMWGLFTQLIKEAASAQPTLYGYDIEHLELIANVLRKENLPPERIAEVFMNIGRIVAIVRDEFEETLRKAVERCTI